MAHDGDGSGARCALPSLLVARYWLQNDSARQGIYADDDFWYGDQQRVTNTRFRGMDRNNDGYITSNEARMRYYR